MQLKASLASLILAAAAVLDCTSAHSTTGEHVSEEKLKELEAKWGYDVRYMRRRLYGKMSADSLLDSGVSLAFRHSLI